MKTSEPEASSIASPARSPYYALLAELRLRAAEATWLAQAKRAASRAGARDEQAA